MRHFTLTAALVCAALLSACTNESEGPDTAAIEAHIQERIDGIIGAPGLVDVEDITVGEGLVEGQNRVRFDAEWTGQVLITGPLYQRNAPEPFGAEWFTTISPSGNEGQTFEVRGSVGYVFDNGVWRADTLPNVALADGKKLIELGTALDLAGANGANPLAGSPEAEAKRAAMAEKANAEAEEKTSAVERSQAARAKRDAELKALVEERRQRKAEEARQAEEARKAQEAVTNQP
jgi:hypothetical protein